MFAKLAKRMLAAVGIVALAVLILNSASAGSGMIKEAFDREQAAHDALIQEHKAFISGNKKYFDDGVY
ncbi:hypothetical protein [Psychrobacter sp. 16-MNA-CIBAN-0192]|uniref:hypothetical protein n=1 Tax=Psychrobacter sp. 16-MNA-CIBAN-0192 TaxID=3140448 RepID=UPI00333421C8